MEGANQDLQETKEKFEKMIEDKSTEIVDLKNKFQHISIQRDQLRESIINK